MPIWGEPASRFPLQRPRLPTASRRTSALEEGAKELYNWVGLRIIQDMKGYNIEIQHQGASFHVQTQDVGMRAQYIESLVYKSGKLLSSRKTFYTQLLNSPQFLEKIELLMSDQHKAILREIAEGKFDHYLTAEDKGETPEGR